MQNGDEKAVDCGGTTCDPCSVSEVLYTELRGGDAGLGLGWVASKNDCLSMGMTLPVIHSQEMLDELYEHVDSTVIWIGLTDSEEEEEYVWVDGSSLTFENWGEREPKNNQINKVREIRVALNSSTIIFNLSHEFVDDYFLTRSRVVHSPTKQPQDYTTMDAEGTWNTVRSASMDRMFVC